MKKWRGCLAIALMVGMLSALPVYAGTPTLQIETGKENAVSAKSIGTVSANKSEAAADNTAEAQKLDRVELDKAAVTKDNKITVTWKKVKDAEGYRIFRKTANTEWKGLANVDASDKLSYTDDTVVAGTTYTYTVRAYQTVSEKQVYGDFDEKGVSAVAKSDAKELAAAVLIGTADSKKGGTIVNWEAVDGAESYRVYKHLEGGKWKGIATVEADQLSYEDTSGETGKAYTYTVRAMKKDKDGKEIQGGYDKLGVKATKLPAMVGLKAAEADGDGNVEVTWKQLSTATGYYVYRKEIGGHWKLLTTIDDDEMTSYTDKNASDGKSYKYTVRAYTEYENTRCYGSYNRKGVTPAKDTDNAADTGDAVELKSADTLDDGTIQINWTASDDCEGYIIFRKTENGKWERLAKVEDAGAESYTDDSGENGTVYTYTVRSYHTEKEKEVMSGFDKKGVSAKYGE